MALDLYNEVIPPGVSSDVIAYGFPKTVNPNFLMYIAPEANKSELDNIKKSLCHSPNLVKSIGKIIAIGELIASSCIASNGMSGGPLILRSPGRVSVIGMLHGGPVSSIHYYISQILHFGRCTSLTVISNFIEYFENKMIRTYKVNHLCLLLRKFMDDSINELEYH